MINFLRLSLLFARNVVNCVNSPYVTFRKLTEEKTGVKQTGFIFFFVVAYFIFVSWIRVPFRNPYLLTMQFNKLLLGWIVGFWGIIILLYFLGKLVSSRGTFRSVFILWTWSLLPTLTWFFLTSFLFIIFPPPRTLSIWGKIYSLVFISFSLSLLFWKLILYYLTLRFAFRIDLQKITIVTFVVIPYIVMYSVVMYSLGIFRIPFI
ncbi:hypothetical protein A2960_06335 [Candidatus Gottesmanbacteria bacterium RIFCSPLOWO2_01_FULL_39_12b]|uniref:Yip1 domain-containing protein n=1 Tax=Candidatus Gottesmanbacteria bacterium RIFCSPLOWO2_01_FULL_39_12b TaxID=1798388 RepID=A0A1F6AQB0_9BACT|nr:MAG: hypothetical protein A2960_06335 [Candidatus Gottesmanbacteria bacterium RIFCSPLOWO2_01_FULL_39_12b]